MIVADDHQHDALGCAGHPDVLTPNLDRLAARGLRFSRAAMMGSLMPAVCSPARASLLTGAHIMHANAKPKVVYASSDSSEAGSIEYVTIAPRLTTLPELCRQAGYRTFITGKWHNDVAALDRSFSEGENIFVGGMSDHCAVPVRSLAEVRCGTTPRCSGAFSSSLFCEAAIQFISARAAGEPFFCYVALTSPHDPFTPPESFRRVYAANTLNLPPAFRAAPAYDNGELRVRDELLMPRPLSPEAMREQLAAYYGMISHHDAEIGRLLAALARSGHAETTYVVYVGDHGLALGRHGLLGKQNVYEHSTRVPLLIAGPGIPAGAESRALIYSLDLFSTVLELTGHPVPAGRESRSLLPQLRSPAEPARNELFALYRDCQRAIREERWKLINYHAGGEHRAELFDLERDPHEERNLASRPEYAAVMAGLQLRLEAWRERIGDQWMPAPPLPPDLGCPRGFAASANPAPERA